LGLAQLVADYTDLEKKGRYWIGRCPFHEEQTPSFLIKGEVFRCFGCGATGGMREFLKKVKEK